MHNTDCAGHYLGPLGLYNVRTDFSAITKMVRQQPWIQAPPNECNFKMIVLHGTTYKGVGPMQFPGS